MCWEANTHTRAGRNPLVLQFMPDEANEEAPMIMPLDNLECVLFQSLAMFFGLYNVLYVTLLTLYVYCFTCGGQSTCWIQVI